MLSTEASELLPFLAWGQVTPTGGAEGIAGPTPLFLLHGALEASL